MNEKKKKAIIIARVSSEEQLEAGNSIPAQINRMEEYCKRNNYDIVEKFEITESAYGSKRGEFDKAIEIINNYKNIAVCFDKVDRLSRNAFDNRVALLHKRASQGEIELHFVSDGQIISSNLASTEKFQFNISLGLASYYSDSISDNVKRAAEKRRNEGKRVGGIAPLGYLNSEDKNGNKIIILDEDKSYLVKRMFELYSTSSYSLSSLNEEMFKLGLRGRTGKKPTLSTIQSILKNKFYYGIQESAMYGDYPHIHPKLISKELYEKTQDIMYKRRRNPNKEVRNKYLLQGLMVCKNCGSTMTPEKKTKKNGSVYIYYSCTNSKGICKREYINEDIILNGINEIIDTFSNLKKETVDYVVKELRTTSESEIIFNKKQIGNTQRQITKLDNKEDTLLDMLIDKTINKEDFDRKLEKFDIEKISLIKQLAKYNKSNTNFLTTSANIFHIVKNIKTVFESSDIDKKRNILKYLFQNLEIDGKTPYFTMKKPYQDILNLDEVLVLGGYWESNSDSRYHKPK